MLKDIATMDKMYQMNLGEFSKKVNENYRKNGGVEEIICSLSCDMEKMFSVEVEAYFFLHV